MGFPTGKLGLAVISRTGPKPGDYYENTYPRSDSLLTDFTAVTTSVFCVQPAQGLTMTLQQVGSNVVANGSGAFNLTGLTFVPSGCIGPGINPFIAFIVTGQTGSGSAYGGFTGPTTFGAVGSLRPQH